MKYKLKTILLKIIALFFPVTCSLCGDDLHSLSKTSICNKCKESLPLIKGLVCQKCGLPLCDGGEFCRECRKHSKEYNFDKMRSVYLYKDLARRLILKFKYSNRSFLARDLGLAMNKTLRQYNFYNDSDFVIPVPLNILRRIKRGYNQAELLAEEISLITNIPLLKNVLFRKKITKPQFKLSKVERSKNIKDSFFVKNDVIIKNKTILLIDDIATTSITVSSCSLALKTTGAKKVYVLTLARD
ncbi:phosphoribosyltransferase [Endomicrobiia bacterium]|nr:phosphoribosyltransferase [Endomicrobiia bacterium]